MGNGAATGRSQPRRVIVFLDGRPDVKMRLVVPPSWEEFVARAQGKLGIPYSTTVKVGCQRSALRACTPCRLRAMARVGQAAPLVCCVAPTTCPGRRSN